MTYMFLDCRYLAHQLEEPSSQASCQWLATLCVQGKQVWGRPPRWEVPSYLCEWVEIGNGQADPGAASNHLPWLHPGQPERRSFQSWTFCNISTLCPGSWQPGLLEQQGELLSNPSWKTYLSPNPKMFSWRPLIIFSHLGNSWTACPMLAAIPAPPRLAWSFTALSLDHFSNTGRNLKTGIPYCFGHVTVSVMRRHSSQTNHRQRCSSDLVSSQTHFLDTFGLSKVL